MGAGCGFESRPERVKVYAELMEHGRRIHVMAREGEQRVSISLTNVIPGAYYRDRDRRWSIPLGMATCRLLRAEYGKALEIGPKLWQWAADEVAHEKRQTDLGSGLGAVELPRIAQDFPTLAAALQSRPYQTRGARFVADGGVVLIADDPGLGKTTETIAGVVESGVEGPYLVCAPVAALNDAWERELKTRLGDDARVIVVTGSKAKRQRLLDEALWCGAYDGESMYETERKLEVLARTWVIVNIEMLRTKSWWICPECEGKNAELRSKFEEDMAAFEEAAIFVLALPHLPDLDQDRWEASDKPKSAIIDCGHNPNRVKTLHEHQFPELFGGREWGALIMDECQRSLLRNSGKQSLVRNGAMMLQGQLRVALSGTPMRGKPQRLWGIFNWLDRVRHSSRWAFIERYWEVTTSGYGGARVIGDFIEDRAAIFNADLNRYMLRRSTLEVSPNLPPKAYMGTPLDPTDPSSPVAVWLSMSPEQAKAARDMAALGYAEVNGGRLQAVGILAILTRLKQFASAYGHIIVKGEDEEEFKPQAPSNKLEWLEQFLRERNIIDDPDEAPTGKVVIVSQFTGLLQMFANYLFGKYGLRYARITGAVTGAKRQHQIDTFNDPDSGVQVMFLNTIAGGVAVTLDAADDMVFLDETHVPDDQKQAEGRIDNRRPEVKVAQRRYWYLKSEGSIDEAIARTNARRDREQAWHLDGRRGVEYAREVFATMEDILSRGGRK
jgi:SNF2 family DNA or RNA helicase